MASPGVITMDEAPFDFVTCVDRARAHDEAAARSLVERLYPLVIKIVRTKLPRRAAEEDLAQEIFLKMFTHLDQYQAHRPFEHWVSRIAVNHCLNAIRAQRNRPEWRWSDLTEEQAGVLDAVLSRSTGEPDPAQAIAARELVEKLLEPLDPEDQLLIRLLEMEERSVEEVRQITGWSAVRIRVRVFRARRKLNQRFARMRKEGNF